jgi:flagellar basal-body rod protein FlgC
MIKRVIFLFAMLLPLHSHALDYLRSSLKFSAMGMNAQGKRLQVITQNLANKNSTGLYQGDAPYRRQLVEFGSKYDKKLGGKKVFIKRHTYDKSDFRKTYMPSHPAADREGYVDMPNVDINIENADSKDAMRSYEANLSMIENTKNIFTKSLDVLK